MKTMTHFDVQQIDPVAYCERCGGEIYPGERVYEVGWQAPLCCVCYVELEDSNDGE